MYRGAIHACVYHLRNVETNFRSLSAFSLAKEEQSCQIVGTGTVARDNLDHALTGTVDEGGGIPCEDLVSFQVRCKSTGGGGHKLQARLTFADTSHSGERVTITVDGDPIPVTINGNRAQISINNPSLGGHTVALTDPPGCFPPAVASCN